MPRGRSQRPPDQSASHVGCRPAIGMGASDAPGRSVSQIEWTCRSYLDLRRLTPQSAADGALTGCSVVRTDLRDGRLLQCVVSTSVPRSRPHERRQQPRRSIQGARRPPTGAGRTSRAPELSPAALPTARAKGSRKVRPRSQRSLRSSPEPADGSKRPRRSPPRQRRSATRRHSHGPRPFPGRCTFRHPEQPPTGHPANTTSEPYLTASQLTTRFTCARVRPASGRVGAPLASSGVTVAGGWCKRLLGESGRLDLGRGELSGATFRVAWLRRQFPAIASGTTARSVRFRNAPAAPMTRSTATSSPLRPTTIISSTTESTSAYRTRQVEDRTNADRGRRGWTAIFASAPRRPREASCDRREKRPLGPGSLAPPGDRLQRRPLGPGSAAMPG